MVKALWRHRALIVSLVRRDFHIRSARAVWGNLWMVIQAAAMIAIYTVIFSKVMGARLPGSQDAFSYGIYLCSGFVTWFYFVEIVSRCQTVFIDNANLLKTLSFPRAVLPLVVVGTATINFAVVAGIFLIALWLLGSWPGVHLWAVLPLLAVQVVLAIGLGVLTGTINVFFRDVAQAVAILLQFWFWLTPIVYPVEIVPERILVFLGWNPLAPIVEGYQHIVLEGALPAWNTLIYPGSVAAGLAVMAYVAFRSLGSDVVDEL